MSKIKCNWCDNVFDEEDIKVKDEEEYCPKCGKAGCLMDLEKEKKEL